jgi:hypothetical protein
MIGMHIAIHKPAWWATLGLQLTTPLAENEIHGYDLLT